MAAEVPAGGSMEGAGPAAGTAATTPSPGAEALAAVAGRAQDLDPAELLARLGSSPSGLGSAEAARRLAILGPNALQAEAGTSALSLLVAQFKNVLIIILLVATGLSFFLGHALEAVAITVIVLFAVLLGFVQEYRAEKAIAALRRMAAPNARVLRDGDEVEVPALELVPGDVVLLRAGDRVPADGRLLEAVNLQVQEAVLTGESLPVAKQVAAPASAAALGDRLHMAYAGTQVSYGRGRCLVTATGMATEFGKIARLLGAVEAGRTPLQENLDRLGRLLARAALAIVAVIVILGLARGQDLVEILIFGVALAVAVVPEALPAVVTISLAIGVQRLARRRALMRRLPAVETLGGTSVICSDKTGTLTRDEMTVRRLRYAGADYSVSGSGYEPRGAVLDAEGRPAALDEGLQRLLSVGALASDAYLAYVEAEDRWRVKGDPTEGALVVAAAKAGLSKLELDSRFPRVEELPFSSETKRMSTLHHAPQGSFACTKGAPEVLLASCDRIWQAQGPRAMTEADRGAVAAAAEAMAGQALRVLAVAEKQGVGCLAEAEDGLCLLGLVGMIDPPRPEARAALATCEAAGIRVMMITGDHPATATAVARELGILQGGRVLTGAELDALDDAAFAALVDQVDVYARVSPEHKLRVVEAWQAKGQVVAMTGDGVNDAPALKKAEIGVAMGIGGTDVAKDAAAMTLTDDNFATIVAAVEEGRGIFDNIMKYLGFLLSSNIGEIGLTAGATALGLPLPLSAVQILYINLATDGLPALALAVDPPEPGLMQRPPRRARGGVFSRPLVAMILIGGLWASLANLLLFRWLLGSGRSQEQAMALCFVALVLIQFCNAYNFRSERASALRRPFANRWLNRAILWELGLLALVVYLPFLQGPLGTHSLTGQDWLLVGLTALTIVPVLELAKMLRRRGLLGAEA